MNEETKKSVIEDDNDNDIRVVSHQKSSCSSNYSYEDAYIETRLEKDEAYQPKTGIQRTQDSYEWFETKESDQKTEIY